MATPTSGPRNRALYRALGLGCFIRMGEVEMTGHTTHLAGDEVAVELRTGLRSLLPEPGTRVQLRLLVPEQGGPIVAAAEVVWVERQSRGVLGRPAIGMGLRLEPTPQVLEAVGRFILEYRSTVVVVGQPDDVVQSLSAALAREYRILQVSNGREALEIAARQEISVLVTHVRLPDSSCMELMRSLRGCQEARHTSVVLTYTSDLDPEVHEVIDRGGVFYFLRAPFRSSELQQAVRRGADSQALARDAERLSVELEHRHRRLLRENEYLRRRVDVTSSFEHLVGRSEAWTSAVELLERVRRTDTTVHLQGETGTGKEMVARALHHGGLRAQRPFVAHNCAGMTESLLQSTLFGHRRGAFTGADRDHLGLFEQANGGTLFLDGVADLPAAVQAALLRVLQEREVLPLGAKEAIPVDVRIISAARSDLLEEVRGGRFREDLYFRLVVVGVRLPPLRERSGDIALLVDHFLDLHCTRHGWPVPVVTPAAMRVLEQHTWSGNVRELENEIGRLVVMLDEGQAVDPAVLSPAVRSGAAAQVLPSTSGPTIDIPPELGFDDAIAFLERSLIERALARSANNVTVAARALQVERTRLTKIRARLGMNAPA